MYWKNKKKERKEKELTQRLTANKQNHSLRSGLSAKTILAQRSMRVRVQPGLLGVKLLGFPEEELFWTDLPLLPHLAQPLPQVWAEILPQTPDLQEPGGGVSWPLGGLRSCDWPQASQDHCAVGTGHAWVTQGPEARGAGMPVSPPPRGGQLLLATVSPEILTFQAGGTPPTKQRDKEADFGSTVGEAAGSPRKAVQAGGDCPVVGWTQAKAGCPCHRGETGTWGRGWG